MRRAAVRGDGAVFSPLSVFSLAEGEGFACLGGCFPPSAQAVNTQLSESRGPAFPVAAGNYVGFSVSGAAGKHDSS